jgi:hypothetical protein
MPAWHRRAQASTRSTSRSPDDEGGAARADVESGHRPRVARSGTRPRTRLAAVVLFFEILLVATVVVITWFALYALYRLITDES